MANPRKFSEKIALHNQKQAEETAAFERIMQEVSVTRVQGPRPPNHHHLNPHPQAYLRSYLGGSLPNVNQMASNPQVELQQPGGFDDMKHPMRHPRFDTRMRPYMTHRRVMPFELHRNRPGHFDANSGQYPGPFLSPPPESNWRSFALSRTNSDSALHQSAMNPTPQDPFAQNQQMHHPGRRDFMENNFPNMPPAYKTILDNKKMDPHLQAGNRPKSCEAPNINVVQSGDMSGIRAGADGTSMNLSGNGIPAPITLAQGLSHVTQIGNNTGSLPDLTNLHIPSPLSNPIDYDESQQQPPQHGAQNNPHSLYNQARSTGNLPAAIPHIGENYQSCSFEIKLEQLLRELRMMIQSSGRICSEPSTVYPVCSESTTKVAVSMNSCSSQSSVDLTMKKLYGLSISKYKCGLSGAALTKSDQLLTKVIDSLCCVALEGGSMRTPTSPNRARRHTHNGPGPSPLSLGSPEHARRIKYSNVTSPKMVGVKPEMKSPPIGGSYTYPYPPQPGVHSPHHGQPGMDNRGWPHQSPDHPGSPSHNQNMSAHGMQPPGQQNMQRHISQQNVETCHPLRVDVNAASKVGQKQQYHRTTQGSLSSPLTSPTSPTLQSHSNFSPVTSPRHEFTTGSNPALSEAYYRSEVMQPLQHQLEQIHVANDHQHHNAGPPMFSCLAALSETSDYDGSQGLSHQDGHMKRSHNNRIPDIVFTGADEQNSSKSNLLGTADLSGFMGHDLGNDYFPGDELKVNLGLDELQMLDDPHIVADPAMEDRLHL